MPNWKSACICGTNKRNILIIDDNQDILEALVADLCKYLKDCNILTATNGLEGQQILQSMPIDLVLSDLEMPVMDGYAFLEQARKNFPEMKLCAMTGACTPQVEKRLAAVGVRQIIGKPFPFAAMASMLKEELAKGPSAGGAARPAQD